MGQKKKISEIKFFTIPSEELTFWFSLFPSSFQDRHSFPGSVCACLGILLWWRDRCKPAHFQWLLFAGIPRFSPFTKFKINLSSHPSFKALCMISWGLYCNCDSISKSLLCPILPPSPFTGTFFKSTSQTLTCKPPSYWVCPMCVQTKTTYIHTETLKIH